MSKGVINNISNGGDREINITGIIRRAGEIYYGL